MTYEALARKYRPRVFSDVVGQPHVVRALSNALESGRIHHAFLFAGTRGVGKTTLARIFAKALNCEDKGVSAEPCGTCSSCVGIDEGRFFDLIEVDAASRTKVDDTRELLDNVQYAPTQGRYKVYLIDEVHMLTGHSFNALLKTLEEPPSHVKFLLATTDPQKLPVTVLSRCLQFNLRALDIDQIQERLYAICGTENVSSDDNGLNLIARGGDGSMRDALSLLDQAIAYGDGAIDEKSVRDMLGLIEDQVTFDLLSALARHDADALIDLVSKLAERANDYLTATDDLLLALNEIAVHQQAPEALAKSGRDPDKYKELAARLTPEDVQLFYQTGLISKRDIILAPDPRSGFEMMLLRMLAFKPDHDGANAGDQGTRAASAANPALPENDAHPLAGALPEAGAENVRPRIPDEASIAVHALSGQSTQTDSAQSESSAVSATVVENGSSNQSFANTASTDSLLSPALWRQLVEQSALRGLSRELAMNMSPTDYNNDRLTAILDGTSRHLMSDGRINSIEKVVSDAMNTPVTLVVRVAEAKEEIPDTPAGARLLEQRELQRDAEVTIATDPAVRALSERFDATIVPESVVPVAPGEKD